MQGRRQAYIRGGCSHSRHSNPPSCLVSPHRLSAFEAPHRPFLSAHKNPERVAAGLKATLHNPNVSEEAKESAARRLKEMGEEGQTHAPNTTTTTIHTKAVRIEMDIEEEEDAEQAAPELTDRQIGNVPLIGTDETSPS
jgi:hypothetical protein